MKKLLYFVITTIFCCGISMSQIVVQHNRDPYADSVYYRALFLQSVDVTTPVRLSTIQDGTFYVYQQNTDGQPTAGSVIFIGMSAPAFGFQPSDTSKIFTLQMPSIWSSYSGNVSAYFMPQTGIVQTNTVTTKNANYTATNQDGIFYVDATSATDTITLPLANSLLHNGRQYTVKKSDAGGNVVRVKPSGSDKIDGASIYSLTAQYKYVTIVSDGTTNWLVVANN